MIKKNILAIFLAVLGFLLIALFIFYQLENKPVDKSSTAQIEVIIPKGMGVKNIGKVLYKKNLIRSKNFFMVLTKLEGKSLKASAYLLKKNMSTTKIIDTLSKNSTYDPDVINITFKEGERITNYAETVAINTNNTYEDFINTVKNKTYMNELISKYWFLSDEILDEDIYYPLEGYLSPDTYQFKNKNVTSKEIIETILDDQEKKLSSYKDKITTGNYSIHQYITLASIIQLEGTNSKNMKMIAGIFNNRLKNKMSLGSDVTTYYGLQVEMSRDLTTAEFNTKNAYNTRTSNMAGKLPVGPICNPSVQAIEATINPTESDYLYFVADKNGKVYYTKTNQEHLKKVQEIKDNGDWIW